MSSSAPLLASIGAPSVLVVDDAADNRRLIEGILRSEGYAVAFSEWNSSPLVKQTTRRGKKKTNRTTGTHADAPCAGGLCADGYRETNAYANSIAND